MYEKVRSQVQIAEGVRHNKKSSTTKILQPILASKSVHQEDHVW